jgi:hypothetical protein
MTSPRLATVAQVSTRLGIAPRTVRQLCAAGTVKGARRFGEAWMIPVDRTGRPRMLDRKMGRPPTWAK